MVDLAVHVKILGIGKIYTPKISMIKIYMKSKNFYKKGVYSFLPKSTLCSWA